jgi:hypothetical protein
MTANVAWDRLEDQSNWYERKSSSNQHFYKWLKLLEIVLAASIPVVATANASRTVLAVLGALVVVLEGVQHLFQFHANWIAYRSTAEQLTHERFLYTAHAGPYAGSNRDMVLARRVEGLVSQEHARWTSTQAEEQAAETAASD